MNERPEGFDPFDAQIAIAALDTYPADGSTENGATAAVSRLAAMMGWVDERGPLGRVIPAGARVLIKPNFVLHQNEGAGGVDCLVTHPSLVRAVVEAALQSGAGEVVVGDAPIQGCDFAALMNTTGLGPWASERASRDPRFKGIQDFRRTTCVLVHGVRVASENVQSTEGFTRFDLGRESLLEPISDDTARFRVAWYDHRLMARTHHRGVHQYLVAGAVIDADVVINLPKLKTHKKAGVTCALKNLIGINGNKEFLPHHRRGGSMRGGDNYPGDSPVKRALEFVSDRQNVTSSYAAATAWHLLFAVLARTSRYQGDKVGMDGSWSGNDTIWRTCLDLNRILLYGRSDGTIGDDVQRRVIHIADAVIAGQGEGPLAPDPLPLGLLLGGNNAAAVDWVGAHLLGYDPQRVPLARHAFDAFRWPIAEGGSDRVRVVGDLGAGSPESVVTSTRRSIVYPKGWVDAARDQPLSSIARAS